MIKHLLFGFSEQVEMIWQQCPCLDRHGSVVCQVLEPGDKISTIFCIQKVLPSFNTRAHDMMEYPRGLPEADKHLRELTVA
jgi:hypothetical protein